MRDSINKANDLIDYAIKLGHEVIAITEHETISNAVKVETYYNKIKEKHPNFKVILGNEIYLVRNGMTQENFSAEQGDKFYHFILLARDAVGHKQLRELSTRAWLRSWKQGKMTRVPTYYQDLIDIIGSNPGHMIASTSCMGGLIPTKLLQYRENKSEEFYEKIKNWIVQMQKLFGKSNFYLEMQPSHNEEQIFVNKELIKLSKELGAKYIITTDSHYMFKDEADIHKAYLNSQDGEREVDSFYATTYMMGDMELRSFFEYLSEEELQEAYQAIVEIKNKCEDYSLKKPLKIPNLKWRVPKASNKDAEKYYDKMSYLKNFVDSEYDSDNIMARLLVDKLEVDETLNNKEAYDELNECLKATWISSEVNKARWSAYFINLQNILDVCWRAGSIVGAGRGSGVGFLLLYALDLIQINSLREDTKVYSWRFLSPKRVSILD